MNIQESIQNLQQNKDFAVFLAEVHNSREGWVSKLDGASVDDIQSIAGRIAALDVILIDCDAQGVFNRFEMKPSMVVHPESRWQLFKRLFF